MANFFRCRVGIIQRSRGDSAIARSAYQACAKMVAPDGVEHDFTAQREAHGHIKTLMLVPADCPAWAHDPQQLWDRAVRAERRCNAQEARTIEISLPRELPANLHVDCVRYLLDPFVQLGMIVQGDFHRTIACDGLPNDHVHVEMTLRRVENGEFSRSKPRNWNALFLGRAQQVRLQFATRLNDFCRRHGIDYHADARTNSARGLPEPEMTLPRWQILLAKRTGKRTAWLQANDDHRAARRQISELEVELQQVERAIQGEEAQLAKAERRRVAERAAFVRRRAYLETARRESLPPRHTEKSAVVSRAPPELPGEGDEPRLLPP